MEEVMLSEPMAKQEVDRYTFRAPGQATSYFYGYSKLEALRAKTEIALAGKPFPEAAYHDFIVNQGLLPLDVLERSVMRAVRPVAAISLTTQYRNPRRCGSSRPRACRARGRTGWR